MKREVTVTHTTPAAARSDRRWPHPALMGRAMQLQAAALHFASLGPQGGGYSMGDARPIRSGRIRHRYGSDGVREGESVQGPGSSRASTHGPPRWVRGLGTAPPALRCRRLLQEHESGRRSLSLNWAQYNTSTQTKSRSLHVIYFSASSVVRRHPRSVCTIRSRPHHRPPDSPDRSPFACYLQKSFHDGPPTTCCWRAWRWAAPIRYPDTADPRCHSEWKTM
jgi:hypothetical protein